MVTAEKNLFYGMFDPGSMYVVVVVAAAAICISKTKQID